MIGFVPGDKIRGLGTTIDKKRRDENGNLRGIAGERTDRAGYG